MRDRAGIDVIDRRIGRWAKRMPNEGNVSGVDPLTVTLRSGQTIHVAHRTPGLALAVGDFVHVVYTGEGWRLLAKLIGANVEGDLDSHNHDGTYAELAHNHDGTYADNDHAHTGWELISTNTASGSSGTLTLVGVDSATYCGYQLRGHVTHTGTGVIAANLRVNGDSGANYHILRSAVAGDAPTTLAGGHNNAATGLFFNTAAQLGPVIADFVDADNTVVGIEFRYRSRGATTANNIKGDHFSSYASGPLTSIQLVTDTADDWASSSQVRLYGLRF